MTVSGAMCGQRPPAVDRKILLVLLVSLALHALVFSVVRGVSNPPPTVQSLTATLRSPVRVVAPSPPEKPAIAKQPIASASQKAAPRPREPIRSAVANPAAFPAAPSVLPSQIASKLLPTEAPVAKIEPSLPSPAEVTATLAGYRQQLSDIFSRHLEYPRVAAMRGWEGEVRLRLKIARKGTLLAVQIERSSGFDVLDQHALALIEQNGVLPAVPDLLAGSDLQVVVPILYKLKRT